MDEVLQLRHPGRWRRVRGPRRRGAGGWRQLLPALLLAAALQLPLAYGLYLGLGLVAVPPSEAATAYTEVRLVPAQQLPQLWSPPSSAAAKPPPPKVPDPPPEDSLDGQVVDLSMPDDPRPPERARYLARWNSRTDRETQAAGRPGARRAKAVPVPLRPGGRSDGSRSVAEIAAAQAPEEVRPGATAPEEQTAEDPRPASPIPVREAGQAAAQRPGREAERPSEPGADARGEPRRSTAELGPGGYRGLLPPLVGELDPGTRGSDDYLPEVPIGDDLSLNAREFRYWSFFQRVKQALRQRWDPSGKLRVRDPWGKVYGVRDRVTVLAVSLDRSGRLQGLRMVRTSGVDFLDDEAMRAFRSAQAFPNVPNGLVDPDGVVRFQFAFAVLRNSAGFRMFGM